MDWKADCAGHFESSPMIVIHRQHRATLEPLTRGYVWALQKAPKDGPKSTTKWKTVLLKARGYYEIMSNIFRRWSPRRQRERRSLIVTIRKLEQTDCGFADEARRICTMLNWAASKSAIHRREGKPIYWFTATCRWVFNSGLLFIPQWYRWRSIIYMR